MNHGSRRPPPGYPPNGVDSGSDRVASSVEYPLAMGPPLPAGVPQQYIDDDQRRLDARSPSIYTQADEPQNAYGARAQSPARDRTSPYGSRVHSPSGTLRGHSPTPAMPPMPVSQAGAMAGTSTRDFNPRRAQSQDPYMPPRTNWNHMPIDGVVQPRSPGRYGPAPVELSTSTSHVGGYDSQPRRPRVNSGGSDIYYEDVDPRFASEPAPPLPPMPQHPGMSNHSPAAAPLLHPGHPSQDRPDSYSELPPTNSYEDLPGARSPAESETSNFTSVSQRGVNPNWRPGNGGEFSSLGPQRRQNNQSQMRQEMLLAGNPDFELPGAVGPSRLPTRGRGGGPGMRGGMMGRGPPRIPPASAVGMGGDGPYPTPMGAPTGGPSSGMGGIREI